MLTTDLDSLTDQLAKSNSTMFPIAEKLVYYNIAYGLLNGLIIDEQEDTFEETDTVATVANTNNYSAAARIHHINWLEIDYGDGFIPARYKSEEDQISEYGNERETALAQWDQSNPIYWFKESYFFVAPTPTSAQAGSNRLKYSIELLPADLIAGGSPNLPANVQPALSAYAAMIWMGNDDPLWQKAKQIWDDCISILKNTTFPRARQQELQAHVPNDDGSDY